MASNKENDYFSNEKNRKTAQFRFHSVGYSDLFYKNFIENDISD